MKTFVKAFKNINNKKGGPHGVKKISNQKKALNLTTLLENFGELTVLSCHSKYQIVMGGSDYKMSLRKSNKPAWISKPQLEAFRKNKRKLSILYSNKGVTSSHIQPKHAARLFIKIN